MKGVDLRSVIISAAIAFALGTSSFGAPARDLSTITNGDPASPIQQWFQHRFLPVVVSSQKEFHDNVGYGDGTYPWGGIAGWHAVKAVVTDVFMDPTEAITGFTVRASVTNDLYDWTTKMTGTDGTNDHGQSAGYIVGQKSEHMRNVCLTASFADDGQLGNLPDTPPFGQEANIYGIDHEWLGWFCYHWGELPPLGSYWVPAWEFTGSSAVTCSGGTPDVILPGETHSRYMMFGCHRPIRVGEPEYDTIMLSYLEGVELFINRTKSLKVSNYPDQLSTDFGVPFPEYPPVYDSDVSVFYDPEPSTIKWQQPPEPTEPLNLLYGWNEPSDWWNGPIAADDWVCTTGDPVTGVKWWGSFSGWREPRPPQLPNHFHIQFWTDVPAGPLNPFSHPGEVVHEVAAYEYQCRFAGWDYDPRTKIWEACFEFEYDFPEGEYFFQNIGPAERAIYWVSIAACEGGTGSLPYPWGWKTRPRDPDSPAPDDAVSITFPVRPTLGSRYASGTPLYWPSPENSWDLAFELKARPLTADLKWDQPPEPGQMPNTFRGWDEKSVYRGAQIVADDWLCQDERPVIGIRWWGSYIGWDNVVPPLDAPPVFHIGIWTHQHGEDDPPSFAHPGQLIHHWWATRDQLNEKFVGTDLFPGYPSDSCFSYEFKVPPSEWFYQVPGPITTIYWLSISAVYTWEQLPQNPWGWKVRPHVSWYEAVRIFDPTAPNVGDWYRRGDVVVGTGGAPTADAAFQLVSVSYGNEYKKWSQPPQRYYSPAFNGWGELSVYGRDQIVADDWVCLSTKPVTDIEWWGSFEGWSSTNLPPRTPDGFHITVWTDVPPSGSAYSHPGEVIWQVYCENYRCEFAGWNIDPRSDRVPEACFKFEQKLLPDQWFRQDSVSGIYWISIAAVYHDTYPQEHLWCWKTRPRIDSLAPDDAVRIFEPTSPWVGSRYLRGEPIVWPPESDNSWDMAFALTTTPTPPGSLTFEEKVDIPDHFWYAQPDPRNEMLSMRVSADLNENVVWNTVTLQAYGTGNDASDIASVDVWIDNNDNAAVDPADTWIGTGQYSADDGTVTITIGILPPPVAPVIINAGSSINVLVSYTMAGVPAPGLTYQFDVVGASGTGEASGSAVAISGLPITSARKISAPRPVSIGQAKMLQLGSLVLLEGKVLTADFTSRLGLFYIEEEDRSAGIGVVIPLAESPLTNGPGVGSRVAVLGQTVLLYGSSPLDGTELAIQSEQVLFSEGAPIQPVGKNNRYCGGGRFGSQPGVFDDASKAALPVPSCGLNDIGLLVRLWGRVACYNWELELPWGVSQVFWIDDGSNLKDGLNVAAEPCTGVAVLMPAPTFPPTGYWGITGIMKAIPNPSGLPVRLLVPRGEADMTHYPEPK